jgi:hypothetical protein
MDDDTLSEDADDARWLDDVDDGCGCAEVWEAAGDRRADD